MGRDGPFSNNVIAGQNTTFLHAGLAAGFDFVDTAIAQVGLLPTNALYVLFRANGINFSVSFAGQNIAFSAIGGGANHALYAGDISAFAGQVGELRFISETTPDRPDSNAVFLDSISFSAVPEPNVIRLTGLGALLFGIYYCRRVSRRRSATKC